MPAKLSAVIDTRVIYCGDNLDQLRKLPDACVDLIYIDPPFNSNRNYEVFWGETKEKRSFEDRHESTKAYVDYMRPRCVELARVLKKTGSFYYHCDWHASHYVKVMLDQIFGENNFINEIIWKRQSAHSDATGLEASWPRSRQHLLVQQGRRLYVHAYVPAPRRGVHREVLQARGAKDGPQILVGRHHSTRRRSAFKGEPAVRVSRRGTLVAFQPGADERAACTRPDRADEARAVPREKRYLDEGKGVPLGTVWDDIGPVQGAGESLGYPTQKPLKLLQHILEISSNENDVVLDAFCGCGTALVAAQLLKRQWLGIDISPTACRVVAQRLKKDTGLTEDEKLQRIGRGFVVRDLPKTEAELRKYPPFEFENWAVVALGGTKNARQVGDMGIDGRIFPVSALDNLRVAESDELALEERFYALQVKQKDKTGRPDIDAFETAMRRAKCDKGFFVSFDYSSDAMREIDRFFREEHRIIVPLTVREILDEEIARKLA